MENVVQGISTVVTSEALWTSIAPAAGFIGAMIVFGFAYRVFKKVVKSSRTGRANI